jgi:predicted MFS family arabinose efflux permease
MSPGLRRTLPTCVALAGAATTFTSLYLAAGALMPLLVVYKEQWNLTAPLLAVTFAVFAIGFLTAVLTVGSLSDHLGRRPVLLGALTIQLLSNVMIIAAPDIGWVIAGRIVQGIATGAATPAFTAALVELAPLSRQKLGMILGTVGLTGGLAAGSLLAGIMIQFTTAANSIIFITLTAVTILGMVVIYLCPESVTRAPAGLRSLVPRIAVPPSARAEFARAAPAITAIWMLSGLSGGLAPSLVRSVFLLDSGLLNGLSGFVAPALSAIIALACTRIDPRRAMTAGIYASVGGAIGIIGGVLAANLAIMIIGQAIAGAGFGASFTASLRLILPRATVHESAGVVAAIYLLSYLAFGVPIVIAGQVADRLGAVSTVFWYTAVSVVLAVISLVAQLGVSFRAGREAVPGDEG